MAEYVPFLSVEDSDDLIVSFGLGEQALPPAWADGSEVADEILGYVAQVRENIEPALAEIARVLS